MRNRLAITIFLLLLFSIIILGLDLNFTKHDGNPVLDNGSSVSWDQWAVYSASVLFDGTGYKMWFTGHHETSHYSAIGLATSVDGVTWLKYNNPSTSSPKFADSDPVLEGTPGGWDYHMNDAKVIKVNDKYLMFYTGAPSGLGYSKIGLATSENGIVWQRSDQPILEPTPGSWDASFVRRPTVIYEEGVFHMWYEGGNPRPFKIGYARSEDPYAQVWIKSHANPVFQLDPHPVGLPHVIKTGSEYIMSFSSTVWNNGTIGIARSSNGFDWTLDPSPFLAPGSPGTWDDAHIGHPFILIDENKIHLWYSGNRDGTRSKVGYAVQILNRPPIAICQDITVSVANSCDIDVTPEQVDNGSYDPDGGAITFNLEPPGPYSLGATEVILTITDNKGAYDECKATINVVDNTAPTIIGITAPRYPLSIELQLNVDAAFTDICGAPHTAIWNWGDGNTSTSQYPEVIITEPTYNEPGQVTGSYTYTIPGVYTITLTITDASENSADDYFQFVVVYDPTAGFVTGGGWINLPEGAYTSNTALTGKANFGFVSKYKKGQSTPDGNTQFHFKVADFKFKSTSYDWLVIAGPQAKYKGLGTVNGEGNYGFMLSAIDGQINGGGGVDKFRIKIWDKNNNENIVYDNQMGAEDNADATDGIEGGSIVIHKDGVSKKTASFENEELDIIPEKYALYQNHPNPFNPETEIQFQLPVAEHVRLTIYNTLGKKVITLINNQFEPGSHRIKWAGKDQYGNQVPSGIYIYQLKAGVYSETKKMSLMK